MRSLIGVLLLTGVAFAAEPIEFHPPAGFTPDGGHGLTGQFSFHAVEAATRTQMLAKVLDDQVAVNEQSVQEFMEGVHKQNPRAKEAAHAFPTVAGRRSLRITVDIGGDGAAEQVVYMIPAGKQTALVMFIGTTGAVEPRLADFDAAAGATKLPPPPPSLSYRLGYATGQVFGILAIVGLIVFFVVRASRKPAV